ncbi:unnamed protein product [Rotaria socialis]
MKRVRTEEISCPTLQREKLLITNLPRDIPTNIRNFSSNFRVKCCSNWKLCSASIFGLYKSILKSVKTFGIDKTVIDYENTLIWKDLRINMIV